MLSAFEIFSFIMYVPYNLYQKLYGLRDSQLLFDIHGINNQNTFFLIFAKQTLFTEFEYIAFIINNTKLLNSLSEKIYLKTYYVPNYTTIRFDSMTLTYPFM